MNAYPQWLLRTTVRRVASWIQKNSLVWKPVFISASGHKSWANAIKTSHLPAMKLFLVVVSLTGCNLNKEKILYL
jgi:hypothetical protein